MDSIEQQLAEYRRKRQSLQSEVTKIEQHEEAREGQDSATNRKAPTSFAKGGLAFAFKSVVLQWTASILSFLRETVAWKQIALLHASRPRTVSALIWLIGQIVFAMAEFGSVYFAVSILVFIYCSLGTRKNKNSEGRTAGDLSAYSVFNPNCERLLGQTTAEQFEGEILRRNVQ